MNGFNERAPVVPGSLPRYPLWHHDQQTWGWDDSARFVGPQAVLASLIFPKQEDVPSGPLSIGDPMHVALTKAAERFPVLVSVGNRGISTSAAASDSRSAYARIPGVLAIGATTDEHGTALASYSGRGIVGGGGPALVAWEASLYDQTRAGTSFAAPRAAWELAVMTAYASTLNHAIALAMRSHVPSIPLSALAWIDNGTPRWATQWKLPAYPLVGVDVEAVARTLLPLLPLGALASEMNPVRLGLTMLLRSARPLADIGAYAQGRGFVGPGTTEAYLRKMSAREWLAVMANGRPEPRQADESETLTDALSIAQAIHIWRMAALLIYVEESRLSMTMN